MLRQRRRAEVWAVERRGVGGESARAGNETPEPTDKAKALMIQGFDDDTNLADHDLRAIHGPHAVGNFRSRDSLILEAFGPRMNGQPLPKDHGALVRLVILGWYG